MMPAKQSRRHRAAAEVIVKMPDETGPPSRTDFPGCEHVHLEPVGVDNLRIERVDRAAEGGTIPHGIRGGEHDLRGETESAARRSRSGRAVLAEARERRRKREHFSGHTKRSDEADERPVGRGKHVQGP